MHSIGTLHVLQDLVDIVNRNADLYPEPQMMSVEAYPRLLARLMALLHDVAHIPFGHTLEDEGNLFPPEWDDARRVEHWLGPESEIGKVIVQSCQSSGGSKEFGLSLLQDVRVYLATKRRQFSTLEFPFVADLVGNTLCADLLDYLERDMYFCGLREQSGDRFISYVAVMTIKKIQDGHYEVVPGDNPDAEARVVLLAYRPEKGS